MKTSFLLPLCVAALLAVPTFAQDADHLRAKLKEIEEHARQAKEAGRGDEVQELMGQAKRLHEELQHAGGGDSLERAHREIGELRKAGKNEEADKLEQKVREMMAKGRGGGGVAERRDHLMVAIDHLRAGGFNDPADSLEKMARTMDGQAAAQHGGGGGKE